VRPPATSTEDHRRSRRDSPPSQYD
jgi:hypothetical protein